MLGKGYEGLYKAPTMEERRTAKRGEGDEIKFIHLKFERVHAVELEQEKRR